LIMGDADNLVETTLLQEKKLPENIDVLIVGHHGAGDTTQQQFIDWVSPEYAVISINENNIRGYPDKTVIARLRTGGAQLHLTFEHGDFIWPEKDVGSADK
jgi:competence protein ComEC